MLRRADWAEVQLPVTRPCTAMLRTLAAVTRLRAQGESLSLTVISMSVLGHRVQELASSVAAARLKKNRGLVSGVRARLYRHTRRCPLVSLQS